MRGCGESALSIWCACSVGCCAPRGWREVAPGVGPVTVVRGVWCPVLSLSRPLVLGAGSYAPLPVFPGRGCCWRGDLSPAPQRALLRASVAAPGGGAGASLGGVPHAVVRGVRGQALFLPPPPVLGVGSRGLLPTFCGCGHAAVGTRQFPPPVLGADDWVWVCVVGLVSVCLRWCVVMRCVPLFRGLRCCLPPSAAPVPPSHPLPRVAVSCVPWCCGGGGAPCPACVGRPVVLLFLRGLPCQPSPLFSGAFCLYPVGWSLHFGGARE